VVARRRAGKERSRFGRLVKKYGLQRTTSAGLEPPLR
jgi:hypothetical protein